MDQLQLWQECCRAFSEREYSAAWESLQRLITIDPRHLEAHLMSGQVAIVRRQWRTAVVAFRKALRLQPDQPHLLLLLAATELEAGFVSVAYRRLQMWYPPPTTAAAVMTIAFGEDDRPALDWHQQLCERCRAALASDGRLLRRLLEKGDQYRELHRIDKSISCYQTFLEFSPDSSEAHFGLGEAYSESRRDQEALEAYQQAVDRAPGAVEPRKKLGLTYIRLGEKEKAAAIWKNIIETNPEERLVAHYLENLSTP